MVDYRSGGFIDGITTMYYKAWEDSYYLNTIIKLSKISINQSIMASQSLQLHFIFFPLMAPGHMIPMIDIAKLLAQRGLIVSIITTPHNATRFGATIDRAASAGLQIRFIQIPFPSAQAGLPEGFENLDSLPSLDMTTQFLIALSSLQKDVSKIFEEIDPPPSCIISDMGLPWTTQIAEKFKIPRIVFHGTCCFSLLCSYNVRASGILDTLSSASDCFEVPNVPGNIVMRKCQAEIHMARKTDVKNVSDQIRAAEKASYGVIVNSFEDLEGEYVKEYSKVKGEKVWCIGPVSLCNVNSLDLSDRGKKAAVDAQDCLKWLELHKPESVVYASLGSLVRLNRDQMIELALGLEASNIPFIWAIGAGKLDAFEQWVVETGFTERIKDRGYLIRGWAPQLLILSHRAVGGFLTHCGWNSTLEGISAGVPMVTWPFFADQFFNEKLVVEVVKSGVSIGAEVPVNWGEEEKVGVLVKKDEVVRALQLVMEREGEGGERRRRVREMAEKAKRSVGEGGSSHLNVSLLIEDIKLKSSGEGSA